MKLYKLSNEQQEITLLDIGATIHTWRAFNDKRNIVISNQNLDDYLDPKKGYFNATIGRYANRIKDGQFKLNSQTYQLPRNFHGGNHGHGGDKGFFNRVFDVISNDDKHITFKYVSKDLEEGYPGNFTLIVKYVLDGERFSITYEATADQDTIANITNHAHFNLSHETTIKNHQVVVSADRRLVVDEDLVPTGEIARVADTCFDLRGGVKLGDILTKPEILQYANGLDHAYLFEKDNKHVHLSYEDKHLEIKTSYPGVQIYSMNHPVIQQLVDNRQFEKHAGIAFEAQYEPNAINHLNFSDVVLKKGKIYKHIIEYSVYEK